MSDRVTDSSSVPPSVPEPDATAHFGRPGPERTDPGWTGPAAPPPPPPSTVTGPAPPPRRSRLTRVAVVAAAATALAVGSGVVGGWVATRFDDDSPSATPAAAPATAPGSLAEVVERVRPSVVSIQAGAADGSGVVFDREGHVITNAHVVAGARGEVGVRFSDGTSAQATVVGTDPRSDLAVVRVTGVGDLVPATFGDSDALRIGDQVLAIGSPLGLDGSVTSGIVSAKDRTIALSDQPPHGFGRPSVGSISGMIQTDAAINPGNSGGALVNTAGEVVGVNTAIVTDGIGTGNIGVGFAIPSNRARQVADQLIAGEEIAHPYLGVSVSDGDGGALVRQVAPGSPAAEAGLRVGDLITAFADQTVRDSDDLVAAVQSAEVGARVEITYLRGGVERVTSATLADAPWH